jgi:Yip1 domain
MDPIPSQNTENGARRFHFEWLLPIFFRPKKTIQTVIEQEKSVWLTPLLIISALVILAGLVAGPIRREAIISGTSTPINFQYYTVDQQAQFKSAQATQTSALFTYIFPTVGTLLGIWISWFILSIILHLSLTLAGSRTSSAHSFNLVAWTMMPLGVRQIVQLLAMLVTHTVISSPGLSGFVTGSGGAAYLAGVLAQIDLYFIWQICLLLYGVLPLSKLTRSKAWSATAFSLLILILLAALPKLFTSLLSGISLGGLI